MRHIATVAVLGVLAGCAAHTSDPAPSPPPEGPSPSTTGSPSGGSQTGSNTVVTGSATAAIDENLERLRGLQIFEVGAFLFSAPNCYGMVCPGQEQEFADAKEAQAKRLADFANVSVSAAAATAPSYTGPTPEVSEQNLQLLRNLQIVGIGELILAQPQANPNCYNLPCAEDVATAQSINNERACQLANIAKAF
jgi:hypothetical protein